VQEKTYENGNQEDEKMSIYKTKGLEMSTWIKNWVVVKEAFKDCKTLLASTLQEKGWSFLVNRVRKATV
jgi:hypothetical protein